MLGFATQLFYSRPTGSASRFCCFTFGAALEISYVFEALCIISIPLIFEYISDEDDALWKGFYLLMAFGVANGVTFAVVLNYAGN